MPTSTNTNESLCIMFSDIAGSTKLYDRLGDEGAERCIADSLTMMSTAVVTNDGVVVKTIGDEILAYFENPDDALEAAKKIQNDSRNLENREEQPIKVRIGLHFGSAIKKDDDIFGDAVNVGARVAGVAKGGQIMISEEVYNNLQDHNRFACRLFDRTHVKGKENMLDIFQVVMEEEDHTQIFVSEAKDDKYAISGLQLDYQGRSIVIPSSDEGKAFSVGRGLGCDLQVDSGWASRLHLEITKSRKKFILTDQSTNGTTVTLESGEEVYLKRESYPLVGKGKFTFGSDKEHLVLFKTTNA